MAELGQLGIKVLYLNIKFGEERDRYIARSKIILNIHAWDDLNVLETIRLSYILANRGFVISENSDHNPYENGILYAPYDQLVNACVHYLKEPRQTRDEIANNGYLAIRKQEMAGILHAVLDRMDYTKLSLLSLGAGNDLTPHFAQKKVDIVELVPLQATRILDIGCKAGDTGADIKKRQDCHVTGVEMQSNAALQAAKQLDLVVCGNAFDIIPDLTDASFDCILMIEVLERVSDCAGLLRLAHSKMTRDGVLVLCVNNVCHWSIVQGLLEGRWEYTQQGVTAPMRFFTLNSLLGLLDETGLQVINRRYTRFSGTGPSAILTEAFMKNSTLNQGSGAEFHTAQFQLTCRKA